MRDLDPTVAGWLSLIVAAGVGVLQQWAAYRWPRGYHRKGGVPDKEDEKEETET